MTTFSQIVKGTRARRPVLLPLGNSALVAPVTAPDGSVSFPATGEAIEVDLRALTAAELAEALTRARADAKAAGVEDPRPDNPIYDLAEMVHTLAAACIDHDSPQDNPQPFFASAEEIRKSPEMGRDRIAYLFERQQQFQEQISPTFRTLDPAAIVASVAQIAGEDEPGSAAFFMSMGPAMRWTCARFMASLLVASPLLKSWFSSNSAPDGASASSEGEVSL